MWRWGEWIWLTGPTGLHWNLPQELKISSIRVFGQIRDPEIPITLRHQNFHIKINLKIYVSGIKTNWIKSLYFFYFQNVEYMVLES